MSPTKVMYRSEREAAVASRRIEFWEGIRLSHYYCKWCNHWHLTSKTPDS